MAKLDRDEFNKKYSEKITDNDELLIELMEDVSDSMEDAKSKENEEISRLRSELEQKNKEYDDLREKYKERFLSSEEMPREKEIEKLEEKEVIDIREI
jgi:hypothetical protein